MRFIALFFFVVGLGFSDSMAREFQCTAQINYRQLEGSGFSFLDDLREQVEEYMNNNNWTEDRFELHELIECSIQIIFKESFTLTSFGAQMILNSTRPIYGTMAKTPVLQISDEEWTFNYSQGAPLVFEIERFDGLTSVLDYYAYLMLGYDYDSFSEYGGEQHFQTAKRIQQLAVASNAAGWSTIDVDGRAGIVDQMTSPRLRPLRQVYYQYHIEALDLFTLDQNAAREKVLEILQTMTELYQDQSRQYVFDIFFGTKYKELVGIFEDSDESGQAYDFLADVDPSRLSSYNALIE
ncbi:MAG: DUF4835 family protein [Bacteroidetes bacterium]|nr:DUF4835 family protein [Bacteroidota bacterium]MCY4204556.1 DUF4835 family protein [Bacteroidota bacterium]